MMNYVYLGLMYCYVLPKAPQQPYLIAHVTRALKLAFTGVDVAQMI